MEEPNKLFGESAYAIQTALSLTHRNSMRAMGYLVYLSTPPGPHLWTYI